MWKLYNRNLLLIASAHMYRLAYIGFPGFFQGDASRAFAAPCISMAELYICPHLILF